MASERQSSAQKILERELRRSEPDYVAYCPKHYDGSAYDSMNEHFLVFEWPEPTRSADTVLLAVWSQCSRAGRCVNRIMFSRSEDDGATWAPPKRVAGPPQDDTPPYMASWAFPMVSRSGRIYVIWNQNHGLGGRIFFHTGTMSGRYSDDGGATWSEPQDIPMPRSPFDDPEAKIPPQWIVWQIPMRDLKGGYIVGYSHWFHKSAARYPESRTCAEQDAVVEFMRFVNIDDDPKPQDLTVRYSAWGENALRVPQRKDPLLSIAQEPSLVRLPDERLFCVMRTDSGYIWYSLSDDDGETWCNPRPLLRKDHGRPILQPVSCCPIYRLADGRYLLLHHNNPGKVGSADPRATWDPRRPAFLALGEFRPGAEQPIWFSESKQFMDTGGYTIRGEKGPGAIGIYGSFTTKGGNNVLWDSDRKCFLIGKKVTKAFLDGLAVPK